MNNFDISRQVNGVLFVRGYRGYRKFDYMDWSVVSPIAERFDCFPMRIPATSGWTASTLSGKPVCGRTPQQAIAMAVVKEVGL